MSPKKATIKIFGHTSDELRGYLAELSEFKGNVPRDLVNGLLGGFEGFVKVRSVNLDGDVAAGTGDLWAVFEPTDQFREFMAAFRTCQAH